MFKYFLIVLVAIGTFVISEDVNFGSKVIRLTDQSRDRLVKVEIWYPTLEKAIEEFPLSVTWKMPKFAANAQPHITEKAPLIVLSHGHRGCRYSHVWLAKILVDHGYIVVAVDHFGNSHFNQLPEYSVALWERPKDISFVLDRLLVDTEWKKYIDTQRIGFAGYSFGGTTGMWLTGARASNWTKDLFFEEFGVWQILEDVDESVIKKSDFSKAQHNYSDSRIKAFFLMAPALGRTFPVKELEGVNVPVAIVSGVHDQIINPQENAHYFVKNIPNSELLVVSSGVGGHFIFLNAITEQGKMSISPFLYEEPENISREEGHDEIGDLAVDFFNHYLIEV